MTPDSPAPDAAEVGEASVVSGGVVALAPIAVPSVVSVALLPSGGLPERPDESSVGEVVPSARLADLMAITPLVDPPSHPVEGEDPLPPFLFFDPPSHPVEGEDPLPPFLFFDPRLRFVVLVVTTLSWYIPPPPAFDLVSLATLPLPAVPL